MNRKIPTPFLLLSFFSFLTIATTTALGQTYQGRATSVRATVSLIGQPVVTTAISDTGNMPDAGGGTSQAGGSAGASGVSNVTTSNASTSGGSNVSFSTASVNNLLISIPNAGVSAAAVQTNAQASCPGGATSGGTSITGLVVNGNAVNPSGSPNQSIPISQGNVSGTLVLNEQVQSSYSMLVNAMHLTVTDSGTSTTTEIVVSSSNAGISCTSPPGANRFTGQGNGVWYTQSNILSGAVSTILADTGPLAGSGGNSTSSTTGAGLAGLLSTGVVTAGSSGGAAAGTPNATQSNANVNNLSFTGGGPLTIGATTLTSNTQCSCSVAVPTCSGSSNIVNLTASTPLGPIPINVTGAPNQVVPLPFGLGSLILNEQSVTSSGSRGRSTATALHAFLSVPGLDSTEFKIADSDSGLNCAIGAPTAAGVNVSGRVITPGGRGLRGAVVILTGTDGVPAQTVTGPLGSFEFSDVMAGQVYVVSVASRQYAFQPQMLLVSDDVGGVDLVGAVPESPRRNVVQQSRATVVSTSSSKKRR